MYPGSRFVPSVRRPPGAQLNARRLTIDRAGKAGGTAGSTAKLDRGRALRALRLTLNGEATGAWAFRWFNLYENEYRMAVS